VSDFPRVETAEYPRIAWTYEYWCKQYDGVTAVMRQVRSERQREHELRVKIAGDAEARIAELEKQLGIGVQTEHRARVLLIRLEGHVRDAREMFHVLRNDKGHDHQGLDMKHITAWLQAVHKTLHPTSSEEGKQ
jgi:hypothetical protein